MPALYFVIVSGSGGNTVAAGKFSPSPSLSHGLSLPPSSKHRQTLPIKCNTAKSNPKPCFHGVTFFLPTRVWTMVWWSQVG